MVDSLVGSRGLGRASLVLGAQKQHPENRKHMSKALRLKHLSALPNRFGPVPISGNDCLSYREPENVRSQFNLVPPSPPPRPGP